MDIAINVVSMDTRKHECDGKSKFFNGTCNKCGAHGHKKAVCPAKTVALLESAPVNEPSEEPVGMGCQLASPDFAPHVHTHTESSVRARSATGQVTKCLGRKTVNFDMSGIASSVNMEVLKISKPIMSAGKVVRSRRKIVLDEHDSYIEDKKTGTKIPVELTHGDVFEVSAHMFSRPVQLSGETSVDLSD